MRSLKKNYFPLLFPFKWNGTKLSIVECAIWKLLSGYFVQILALTNCFWCIPADTIPLFSGTLAILHAASITPLIIVVASTESQSYQCPQKTKIRLGLFGILSLYLLSFVLECFITAVGLRGGPLQEKKRRLIGPLLYIKTALLVLIIIVTAWDTYLVQDNSISHTCWSDNPCAYAYDVIPAACTSGISRTDVQLTESCENVISQSSIYLDDCFNPWFDYASTW